MSQDQQEVMIPYLKKDAQVSITLGTGFIERLQEVLMYILQDKEKSTVDNIKNKLDKNEKLDDWEITAITMTSFLQHILKSAQESGQTVDKPLKDIINPQS